MVIRHRFIHSQSIAAKQRSLSINLLKAFRTDQCAAFLKGHKLLSLIIDDKGPLHETISLALDTFV